MLDSSGPNADPCCVPLVKLFKKTNHLHLFLPSRYLASLHGMGLESSFPFLGSYLSSKKHEYSFISLGNLSRQHLVDFSCPHVHLCLSEHLWLITTLMFSQYVILIHTFTNLVPSYMVSTTLTWVHFRLAAVHLPVLSQRWMLSSELWYKRLFSERLCLQVGSSITVFASSGSSWTNGIGLCLPACFAATLSVL